MIDVELIIQSLPALLHGALMSLQIACASGFLGLTLGTILAMTELSKNRIFSLVANVYVTLFRGTPMLVQILFVYYVLPQFGLMIAPFWAASLAIGLNSSAYVSQSIRTGLNAVDVGQIESAKTLGFNRIQIMRLIVLPQAFRIALPSLGNELITLIKDSSLASVIGVMELSKEASMIRSRTYDAFSVLLAVSVIYLVMTSVLSWILKRYEKWSLADA
jgi:His/Glu/Gln/Arg/opine family amino acid ABC transporter permease subunit